MHAQYSKRLVKCVCVCVDVQQAQIHLESKGRRLLESSTGG
jgi:hypothetical protein